MAPPPPGLHAPTEAAPLDADALELLGLLIDAGPDGVHLGADRQRSARDLHGRHLSRPTAQPGGVAVALSWHRAEAERMSAAAPGALDGWAPGWWPAGALEMLAAVVVAGVGDDLALWFAASVAGLEADDGRRSITPT